MKKRPVVLQSDVKRRTHPLDHSTFHHIGPLTRLLIAGDLVYAGIIAPPTVEEMGSLIASLSKGALHGLIALNLLRPAEKGDDLYTEKVTDAFATLYTHLEGSLESEQWKKMGMDVLVLEHSLCKFKRLKKYM